MSHLSSSASSPSPARSSVSRKYLAKSTGSGVGCSPCGGWVGSGSRILNQVTFRCNFQSDTFLPPLVLNTSSDMLSKLVSAIIHQWTAWHRVRQNCRTEHHVHTATACGKQKHASSSITSHYYDLYCCHCVTYYCPLQVFTIFLSYLYNIWQWHGKFEIHLTVQAHKYLH